MYLYSVEGRHFINDYVLHQVKMSDKEYVNVWRNVFEKYKTLYDVGYYNLLDLKIGNKTVTDFEAGLYQSLQINADSEIFNIINNDAYTLKPFVGNDSDQQWIGIKPIYYISACKNNRGSFIGVESFIDYYVSPENQGIIKHSMSPTNVPYYVSFFKRDHIDDEATKYVDLDNCIKRNHIVITDTFLDVFKNCSDNLKDYIDGEIDVDTLISQIDTIVFKEDLNHEN